MKLPVVKKILREDLKGAPDWVNFILDPFNSFAETIYQALNKNITFEENVRCFIKDLSYRTDSAYPVAANVQFMNTLKVKATGVQVLQVINQADYTPPPGPVYIPWTEDNGNIIIRAITGLEADKLYMIRLLVS